MHPTPSWQYQFRIIGQFFRDFRPRPALSEKPKEKRPRKRPQPSTSRSARREIAPISKPLENKGARFKGSGSSFVDNGVGFKGSGSSFVDTSPPKGGGTLLFPGECLAKGKEGGHLVAPPPQRTREIRHPWPSRIPTFTIQKPPRPSAASASPRFSPHSSSTSRSPHTQPTARTRAISKRGSTRSSAVREAGWR